MLSLSESSQLFRSLDSLEKSGLKIYSGNVPGNFELDLHEAGEIEDPLFGMNIVKLRQWETHHVYYGRRFNASVDTESEAVLRFEGLDCFGEVFLNGEKIGECDNALIEHEFSVRGLLREGENDLLVHIRPAITEAKQFSYPPALAAARCNYESLYVRKAPHCFGWDIMPRVLSGGLWRSVFLVSRPPERLNWLFLRTLNVKDTRAHLILSYRIHTNDVKSVYELEIDGRCDNSHFHEKIRILFDAGRHEFQVSDAQLWWPRGRGKSSLYAITVRLLKNGETIDVASWRHGIRTIFLDRSSTTDTKGRGSFQFIVNNERIFVLGTNWVPVDVFHSRDTARIPCLLELVEELGCNMIRCWGGNVYENDAFFDLCDEKGFLVWQDFAFGCAIYPQNKDFQKRVEIEASAVIQRLRQHACLALWAGDNECDSAYGWNHGGDPNHNVLTRHLLADAVRTEDPGRTYLPSSPFIDKSAFQEGESFLPENHLWGPRDGFKSNFYKDALCHFVSEIGYHGCPSVDSVKRFISPENLWPPTNAEWLLHASSPIPGVDIYDYRIDLMKKQIREFFGYIPDNLEAFSFQSQCVQAEALKFFIESFRSGKWRRTGIIWWNLCDGWPQFSDAVVDYYLDKKLAFDFVRRSQAPLCLVLREPSNWTHELVACNDTRDDIVLNYSVIEVGSGKIVQEGTGKALADAATTLANLPASISSAKFYILKWTHGGGNGINHFLTGTPPYHPTLYKQWISLLNEP